MRTPLRTGSRVLVDGVELATVRSVRIGSYQVRMVDGGHTYMVTAERVTPVSRCFCGNPINTPGAAECAEHD